MQIFRFLICMLVCVSGSIWAFPAQAALGEEFLPASAKQAKSTAPIRVLSQGNYTVNEYTMDSGTVVREFIAPTNIVFAVVWRGPSKPDLSQLYGQYYPRYVAATAKQSRPRSRHFSLREPDLVVSTKGRMGNFSGVSYLPNEMPAGVTEADLQ